MWLKLKSKGLEQMGVQAVLKKDTVTLLKLWEMD
jgi:hypothetical protein